VENEKSAQETGDIFISAIADLISKVKELEKKVADLERQLADRQDVEKTATAIIEKLRTAGIRI